MAGRDVELREALMSAYVTRDDLVMVLDERLDRRLDDITMSGSFRNDIYRLIAAAKAEGWLDALVAAVLADRPGNPELAAWAARYQADGNAGPSPRARPDAGQGSAPGDRQHVQAGRDAYVSGQDMTVFRNWD